jgi:protein-L-isoaspartate(D-aspartate) O-methyltransferase
MDMVDNQIVARGVRNKYVLEAMRRVPRHEFVPPQMAHIAYDDRPLPIGESQTISQPYIVASMTELAGLTPESRVLEIGTGSGYQAAVLAEITREVYSIEIIDTLAKQAGAILQKLGYKVHQRVGDGYAGWPDKAPFDAIIVTAAPPHIPQPLKDQLKVGGHLVIPVGDYAQELLVITRTKTGWQKRSVYPVRFVPMTGKAQKDAL